VTVLAGAAITAPHLLRLERTHPATAAVIWLAAVCLRALVASVVALFIVFYMPTTGLFDAVTHWCWHLAVPLVTAHLGLSGHRVGGVALLAPAFALGVSMLSVCLDDEELAASLEHERGHVARRHRFALVIAEVCRASARALPGTRHAVAELIFHLERDADRLVVDRLHDPAALASAICKAGQPPLGSSHSG